MKSAPKTIRCAIYTRKSTDEGLEQDFNSLDAQRETGEAFIASQKGEGWICLETRYDDGGFSGGNMERPALQRLLEDIQAGKIDCVVIYKLDRLSRSLLDFARILEIFERSNVSFVAVTQQFNTATSMGRLMLNILLSFAQFEREMISERTRDKMAAARRKGKYVGGPPILGYDIDRDKRRLVVNEREAKRVREMFQLYLDRQSLLETIAELDRRGWKTKRWTTKKGAKKGGRPFDKNNLYGLLTNVAYIGKISYKDEIYEGEHPGVVDPEIFEEVQRLLRLNYRSGGPDVRNRYAALLKGLLHCVPCGCGMTHSHSTKDGKKRYRYYVCVKAQKRGWKNCPSRSIPAPEIERFVVDQIRQIADDPTLIAMTLEESYRQVAEFLDALASEKAQVDQEISGIHQEMRTLASAPGNEKRASRLADLHERLGVCERRQTEIRDEILRLEAEFITEETVAESLAQFDPTWDMLSTAEKSRLLRLLIERVEYDGEASTVSVTYRPTGFRAFAEELQGVEA